MAWWEDPATSESRKKDRELKDAEFDSKLKKEQIITDQNADRARQWETYKGSHQVEFMILEKLDSIRTILMAIFWVPIVAGLLLALIWR